MKTSTANPRQGVVVFLGAGASAWAGYRTFLNFPAMFWPSGNEPSKLEVTDKERTLLKEIRAHLAKRHLPPTLDSYLAAIQEFQAFTSNSVSHTILRERLLTSSVQWASVQELRKLLLTIRDRVCRLTAQHYRQEPPQSARQHVPVIYDFFSTLYNLSRGNLGVFTTNYDILPEYLFADHDNAFSKWRSGHRSPFLLNNGFPAFHTFHPPGTSGQLPTYDSHYADKAAEAFTSTSDTMADVRSITWHRLHGCVAWLRGPLGSRAIEFNMLHPVTDGIEHFPDKLCVSYSGHEEFYGRDPHQRAFRTLAHSIATAHLVVFVGFAFRDPDVMAVIARSLDEVQRSQRKLPLLLIVDPQLTRGEAFQRVNNALVTAAGPSKVWDEEMFQILPEPFPSEKVTADAKAVWKSRELEAEG